MATNESAERAKHHLPSVLLTLLSIVQALALELVWEFVSENGSIYVWSFENAVVWLQVAATFLGVLLIWLTYSGLVMRLRWVPSNLDSILPFLIGVVEFALVGSLGVEHLARWFSMLAIAFGIVTFVVQHSMRRARLDGDNDEFFAGQLPATRRDFMGPVALVLSFAFCAWLLRDADAVEVWMLGTVLFAAGTLSYQMYLIDYFWRRSIAGSSAC